MAIKSIFARMVRVIKREENHKAQVQGYANDVFDSRILHMQGVVSGVPDNTQLLALKVGQSAQHTVVLPIKVDKLEAVESGELLLYATQPSGAIVGNIILSNNGKIGINTQQDDLLAILQETLKLLQELQTFGSPNNHTPLPSWTQAVADLQQRLDALAIYQ